MTIKSWRQSSLVKEIRYENFSVGYPPTVQGVSAADGGTGTTATVSFTNQTGATLYTAISTPGSFTATGASSPITVSGLTAGTAYTFQVTATNATGQGPYSAASNSVTPVVPSNFFSIATVTGTGNPSALTFSSIPSGYKSLQIRGIARDNTGGGVTSGILKITFNGDNGSNYSYHRIFGAGLGTIVTDATASSTFIQLAGTVGSAVTANAYGVSIVDIIDYTSTTKYKTSKVISGGNFNGGTSSGDNVGMSSGLWSSTSAITSVTITTPNTFTSNTTFTLYGVS
jgi:hypothetical protein